MFNRIKSLLFSVAVGSTIFVILPAILSGCEYTQTECEQDGGRWANGGCNTGGTTPQS